MDLYETDRTEDMQMSSFHAGILCCMHKAFNRRSPIAREKCPLVVEQLLPAICFHCDISALCMYGKNQHSCNHGLLHIGNMCGRFFVKLSDFQVSKRPFP